MVVASTEGKNECIVFATKQPLSGFGKQLALPYCSYVGMYIFAQDQNIQYLGLITSNQFNTESIINDFGDYGSQFSSTSIRNQFSTYGSQFSSYSAYNEFTSTPPIIYSYSSSTGKFTAVAYLTKNTFKLPAVDPDLLIATLKAGCLASISKAIPSENGLVVVEGINTSAAYVITNVLGRTITRCEIKRTNRSNLSEIFFLKSNISIFKIR